MRKEKLTPESLARHIDHTVLKPEAARGDVEQVCAEALEFGFAAVCVPPAWLHVAVAAVAGTATVPSTVIGFPFGYTTTTAKVHETRDALAIGAREVDMVINIGALKCGDDDIVRADIAAVVEAAAEAGVTVKVILETALLDNMEKRRGCRLAVAAGAAFVKTSTGFATAGATIEDVVLMREVVGTSLGIKAAGGIRDLAAAVALLDAGADRLGTSASVAIVNAARR